MNIAFHLGLHKTASTWFQQEYFAKHPDIVLLNNASEPWNDEIVSYLVKTSYGEFDAEYYYKLVISKEKKDCNKVYIISAERLSGHPYSGAYDRQLIITRINKAFSNAKIFIFYRDQVQLIDSVYKQLISEGYTGSINDMLSMDSWKKPFFNMDIYKYDLMLKNYLEVFEFNSIGLFNYDLFRENKLQVLNELNEFLGINHMDNLQVIEGVITNKSYNSYSILLMRFLNYFNKSEYNETCIKMRFTFLLTIINKITSNKYSMLNDYQKDRIFKFYEKSNQLFQELINVRKACDR